MGLNGGKPDDTPFDSKKQPRQDEQGLVRPLRAR
jgi:hypothetical protein